MIFGNFDFFRYIALYIGLMYHVVQYWVPKSPIGLIYIYDSPRLTSLVKGVRCAAISKLTCEISQIVWSRHLQVPRGSGKFFWESLEYFWKISIKFFEKFSLFASFSQQELWGEVTFPWNYPKSGHFEVWKWWNFRKVPILGGYRHPTGLKNFIGKVWNIFGKFP